MFILILYFIIFSSTYLLKIICRFNSSRANKSNFNDESYESFSNDIYSNTPNTVEFKSEESLKEIDQIDAKVISQNVVPSEERILRFASAKSASRYSMNLKRRGKCVIFNHTVFSENHERKGSVFDQKIIESTFSSLGFEPVVHLNLDFFEIMDEVKKLREENHEDCDCICIFVLSHGSDGNRLAAKDTQYFFQSIWIQFTADMCPTLASKPKLFFIQACRGYGLAEGVQGRCAVDSVNESYVIPTHADFLYGYSTVDGFYSFRDIEKGSRYIQSLCSVIQDHWRDTDLLRMLTITARKVGIEYESTSDNSDDEKNKFSRKEIQMPSTVSTLTRDLYFTPKDNS